MKYLGVALAFAMSLLSLPATAAAAPAFPGGATYVALGDSGTATTGVVEFDTSAPLLCARSGGNAPKLVAAALGVTVDDRSCSGAKIRDLTGRQFGTVAPQLDALGPATKIVTLHIGANDADFSRFIVGSCHVPALSGGSCAASGDPSWDAGIDAIAPAYRAALDEISRRAPAAKIFVDGWPTYFDPGTCDAVLGLAPADTAYIQSKFERLNTVVSREAKARGATYIDTIAASTGRGMCAPRDSRWFDPILGADTLVPYHPTLVGQQGVADLILSAIRTTGTPLR